ncbi:hypothetical protein HanIR_Chr02g0091771 [Helianthus annuus]|nr:hypothetical protein HanIR_Chr02g0091771 [Helianthus annuus]
MNELKDISMEVLIDRRKRLTSLEGFSCELCKDKHVFLVVIWHLLSFFANWVQYPRHQGPGSSDITMNHMLTDDMELEQAAATLEREKRSHARKKGSTFLTLYRTRRNPRAYSSAAIVF